MYQDKAYVLRAYKNLYVGNLAAGRDVNLHNTLNVAVVINLSGGMLDKPTPHNLPYVFDCALPRDELLDAEFDKTNSKLHELLIDIPDIDDVNTTFLIVAEDYRNSPMLAVGYVMINKHNLRRCDVVEMLELADLNESQRAEELSDRQRPLHEAAPYDPEAAKRKVVRNSKLCLTFASFRKILDPPSTQPQRRVYI